MGQKIQRYDFLEVVIPQNSTGTKFYFPDQPQLRFVSMLKLEVYTPGTVTNSILSGNPLLTIANLRNTFLVLYYNDKESVNRIPLMVLNNIATNSTTAEPYTFNDENFNGQQVIWSKSYIQTTTAYSGITTSNFSVCFGVYYA
jgi:hypothetical protein